MDINGLKELVVVNTITYAPKVFAALLIFIAFHFAYKLSAKPIKMILHKTHMEKSLVRILIDNIYRFLLLFMGLMMAANQLGIDVGAALAGIGIAGIAIGFAAQDVLSSVIAGFMIFFDKPFKVGDWISVDGNYGEVTEVTIRSTRIRTLNNTYVVIPNKIIVDEVLDNHSLYGETRVEVPVGIAYKEDIPKAREVLLEAIEKIEGVDENPAPDVVVDALGDSSVNLIVRVWISKASTEKPIYYATMEAAKLALDKAGIEIPFPHMQLFVEDVRDQAVEQMRKVGAR